eukprot:Seg4246.3 transcript_id=Seg4246.3/GoldUCD/mRNA.D3Y31 product="hypothetical protein" protein_id=Seg4246.3/GoldUCD/D3Y31
MSTTTREKIVEEYWQIGIVADDDEILDIDVSFDGSWQKRGHSSHNGDNADDVGLLNKQIFAILFHLTSSDNIIWTLCPKTVYVRMKTIETGVSLAACQFNMWATFKSLMCKILGIEQDEYIEVASKRKNLERKSMQRKHIVKLERRGGNS